MYVCNMKSKELLKGTLKTIVLKLLSENERMYGYEITQRVKERTQGQIVLTEGALYPTLHKLEADGLVRAEKINVGRRVRKYYHLTPAGSEATTTKLREFEEFLKAMQLILKPKVTFNESLKLLFG